MDSSTSRNNSDVEKNDELDAIKRIAEITSDADDFINENSFVAVSRGGDPKRSKNCSLVCIDFTMETDRKHLLERNLAQFGQYSVDSGKSYELSRDTLSKQLARIENDASESHCADDNKISRIFDNLIGAMKITSVLDGVRNNERLDFSSFCSFVRKSDLSYSRDDLFVSDDGCSRLYELFNNLASSNLSSPEPMTCSLERSNSWQFCSFSSKHPSIDLPCSSSTSSSICSLTQFNQILRSIEDKDAVYKTDSPKTRFSTFEHRKRKSSPVKRSYSDNDLRKLDDIQIQIESTFNDIRLQNTNFNCYENIEELDSDYENVACKRAKIDISSVSLTNCRTNNIINCDPVINRLSEEFDTRDIHHQCTSSNWFPRQLFDKLSSTNEADANDQRSTLRTDTTPGRMRSLSVTLERCRTAANVTSNRSRQMQRSHSVDVMDSSCSSESEKRFQNLANRNRSSDVDVEDAPMSTIRPLSWMRASMRFVRPFHLADPPQPSEAQRSIDQPVQIHLPPVFPCDVVERPCSAPMPDRPRQYGRSGQRRLSSRVSSESPSSSISGTENWHAPSTRSPTISRTGSRRSNVSEAPTISRNESVSSSTTQSANLPANATHNDTGAYEMSQESESPLGQWNHGLSSMLACVGCTLGIFNISRFAIFSIHFGANFILQFLVLTVLIGIPLFTFHISLGQLLGTGVLNMWHISPIFKGIGVALLLSQAFIGIYSIIGVSWMFVYFKDSFISKQDVYRWAEPLELYGEDGVRNLKYNNGSYKIEQTVPDYFSGVVLQRRNVLKQEDDLMNVKFSVAFNLAIVWIIIFLSLSKGLKSYGKVVYVFSILPIFGMTLLCAKLLGFLPGTVKSRNFFPETDWSEFFLNSKSWVAAFTEVFLTWGVFGASAMQITSHNRQKHFLYRDSALVIVITVSVLLLAAFIANMCSQLLEYNNFLYLPSSFERTGTYSFLQRMDIQSTYSYSTTPIRWMIHSGLILGERTIKPGTNPLQESGYQPLRLATELVPATFAAIGPKIISPFWSVLFYFVFIMFGISQQMAIWYGVISNIVAINVKALKPCWTTITWFTCIGGFILGLPMTMETGIFVVYFLDFVIGCGWWIMILYLLQLGAVFIVRGRPYSGETIVATLFTRSNYFLQNWIAPMFSFNWNVILPVTLLLLSTSVFKNGGYRVLYNWNTPKFYEHWALWVRKCGCLLQILPLFTVPLVGIIQSYLYLTEGPLDLFERIQQLYRPVLENTSNLRSPNVTDTESNNRISGNNNTNVTVNDDPPPKYTPPPSYSTATGARIAKLLRQSFRRSVIRIAHVLGTSDSNPSTSEDHPTSQRQLPPPPDYSTVLVEINQSLRGANLSTINSINPSNMSINESTIHRNDDNSSTLTAQDVANILRSSLRRNRTLPVHNNLVEQECTSIQCLVESAAPINQDSIIMLDELKTQQQT